MNARLQVPMSPTLVQVTSLAIAIVASGPEIGRAQEKVASRLEGTYWKAIELGGKPTPTQDPKREAHLRFQAGDRVSGSDGCNRITGSYQLKGDRVTFGQIVGTQMACLNAVDIERPFRDGLNSASRLTVTGRSPGTV
jgi:copper homeostasis protein (lipoprotein)